MFAAMLAVVSIGASLVTIPPFVYAILGCEQPTTCAIGAAAWTAVMCMICWAPILLMSNTAPTLGILIAVTFMNLAFAGLVSLGLLLVRNRGYRLRRRATRTAQNVD